MQHHERPPEHLWWCLKVLLADPGDPRYYPSSMSEAESLRFLFSQKIQPVPFCGAHEPRHRDTDGNAIRLLDVHTSAPGPGWASQNGRDFIFSLKRNFRSRERRMAPERSLPLEMQDFRLKETVKGHRGLSGLVRRTLGLSDTRTGAAVQS